MSKVGKLFVALALPLLGGAAWFCQRGGGSGSAEADLVIAGLGGFRGIIAEVVWFRADRLQDEGRYSEMAQLATILTSLEPHTPEVWAYAAWNLAYNISVMMPTAEDRWRWVEAGLKLLRDDGLRLNPASPVKLNFTVSATDASTFTVWSLTIGTDKKGNTTYTQKSKQATTLKKAKGATTYTAQTRNLFLEAGDYYVSVQAANASKCDAVYYNVTAAGPQPVQSAQDSSALSMPDAASAAFADAAAFDVLNNEQSWQSLVSLA